MPMTRQKYAVAAVVAVMFVMFAFAFWINMPELR